MKANYNNNINKYLKNLLEAAQKQDMNGVLNAIMDMPDKEFNAISDKLYETFGKTYNSIGYQNAIARDLATMDQIDYETAKDGYDKFIKLLNEVEDISEDKKKFLKYIFDNSYAALLEYEKDPSEKISVKIQKLVDNAVIPDYAHVGDAGADLYSTADVEVLPHETALVPTGLVIQIPKGYEAQVRPRSGMSLKTKIRVANAPGTIDSNYRGEIKVIIDNNSDNSFVIHSGDKIAQLVFNKVPIAQFVLSDITTETNNTRGADGFGSTDKKSNE